jgi:hypothetical protein
MTGGTFGLRSFILLPMTIGSREWREDKAVWDGFCPEGAA